MSYYFPAAKSHNPTGIWNSVSRAAATIISWLQYSSALIVVMHFFCKNVKESWVFAQSFRELRDPKPCCDSGAHNLCKHQDRSPQRKTTSFF